MIYTTNKKIKDDQIKININNNYIDTLSEFKYLGLLIDKQPKLHSNIKSLKQKINAKIYTLKWVL